MKNFNSDQVPHYETIEFERILFQIAQSFYPGLFQQTKITVKQTIQELMIKLRQEIYGQHHYQKYVVYIDIPDGWWETFKYEKLPGWWQHQWPIKWKTVEREIEFDHKKLFPESTIKAPSEMGPVVFHSSTNEPGVMHK